MSDYIFQFTSLEMSVDNSGMGEINEPTVAQRKTVLLLISGVYVNVGPSDIYLIYQD